MRVYYVGFGGIIISWFSVDGYLGLFEVSSVLLVEED